MFLPSMPMSMFCNLCLKVQQGTLPDSVSWYWNSMMYKDVIKVVCRSDAWYQVKVFLFTLLNLCEPWGWGFGGGWDCFGLRLRGLDFHI